MDRETMIESLEKRSKEKRFTAGVNWEQIASCSEIGLEAMQGVAEELRLMPHLGSG